MKSAVYEALTIEDEGRVCEDIPDAACDEQPENLLRHVVSLASTKTGDGLADPKLVLPWLLGALGAPASLIGLLVPLREAGALLPQLFVAARIRARPRRKWVWAAGSAVQGLAVLGMAASALMLEGDEAGRAIVGLLAVFALARSACSVSYKDVLGKTISKTARGTTTGTAASIAAGLVLGFGLLLSLGWIPRTVPAIAAVLAVAGGLWLLAAVLFSTLAEARGATEGGGNPVRVAREQLSLLREDPQLRRFILARSLLVATALAPPYLLAAAGRSSGQELGALGPFVLASALATMCSSFVWGRLSDRSSRRVLMRAAGLAALVLAISAAASATLAGESAGLALPPLLFALMIAYQGVRVGRSTHLVDMADAESRAAYTALSNSVVGVVLVVGGVFGALAEWIGEAAVLVAFAALCAAALGIARGLDEVQRG